MIVRILSLCVLLFLISVANNGAAEVLTPQAVLQSAQRHSPQIMAAQEYFAIADAVMLEAKGAFDPSIEQEVYSRIDGFYDGQHSDTKLVKPFPAFNSTVYTGYRISDGSYPVYEDKYITTDDGEWMVGVTLSLLRNRNIDARRLALLNAQLKQDGAQAEFDQVLVTMQEQALLSYCNWVAAGLSYQVYKDLLDIAQQRQDAFEVRVSKGDLPRIYLTENKQYIVQRKADVAKANQEFLEAANALSLFYRNAEGQPVIVASSKLPHSFEKVALVDTTLSPDDNWMDNRPEMRQLALDIQQLDYSAAYGENLRLPAADLMLEHANDYGEGYPAREEAETIVKLNVSIPLQQRAANGAIQQAQAKKRQLMHEKARLQDTLRAQYNSVLIAQNTARNYVMLAEKEIALAQTMHAAEQQRIANGDSDYFVLIMRDENLVKARIKQIYAQRLYQQALARKQALMLIIGEESL